MKANKQIKKFHRLSMFNLTINQNKKILPKIKNLKLFIKYPNHNNQMLKYEDFERKYKFNKMIH